MKKIEVTVTYREAAKVEELLEKTELVYLSSEVEIEGENAASSNPQPNRHPFTIILEPLTSGAPICEKKEKDYCEL